MGSLINIPSVGRAVASMLGVMDQKGFPEKFNTDELQAVLALLGPNASETWADADLANHGIGGLASTAYAAFGSNQTIGGASDVASPVIFGGIDSLSRAHWVRAFSMILTYDNAGSIADNAVLINFLGWLYNPKTNRLIPCISHCVEEKSGVTNYQFVWPQSNVPGGSSFGQGFSTGGSWNGYIPPGWMFVIEVIKLAGGLFPANTTINGKIAVSEMPDGFTYSGPT